MLLFLVLVLCGICSAQLFPNTTALTNFLNKFTEQAIQKKFGLADEYRPVGGEVNYRWRVGDLIMPGSMTFFDGTRNWDPVTKTAYGCQDFITNKFFFLASLTYWQMGTKDTKQLASLSELQQIQMDELIDFWSQPSVFGPSPYKTIGQVIDGFWNRSVAEWITPTPPPFPQKAPTEYLRDFEKDPMSVYIVFDLIPPAAKPILDLFVHYFTTSQKVLALIDQGSEGRWINRHVLDNIQNPTEANGAQKTNDGKLMSAFDFSRTPAQIYYDLHNTTGTDFHIKAYFRKTNTTATIYVDDKEIPQNALPKDVQATLQALPVGYYVNYTFKFDYLAKFVVNPRAFDVATGTGWWYPSMVCDAVNALNNQTYAKEESGWRFWSEKPNFDLRCFTGAVEYVLIRGYRYYWKDPGVEANFADLDFPFVARMYFARPLDKLC